MKELMRKAHQLTKEIKAEFPEVDYKAQLGICISYLSKKELTIEETIAAVENIDVCNGYISATEWEKGDYHRIYVNHYWKVRGGREGRRSSYGYFVVKNGVITQFLTEIKSNTFAYSSSVRSDVQSECIDLLENN